MDDVWDLPHRLDRRVARFDRYADDAARVGLGLTILLAGLHKLVDPGAWALYLVAPLPALLPTSPVEFMLINGVLEPPFALALLADRYTTPAAAFVALSLAATAAYLAVVGLTRGLFVDVLIRDVGLFALAATVTVRSAGGPTRERSTAD